MEKIYILVANCKFVKGYLRSAIYDLGRQELYYVPNEMRKIIDEITQKQKINIKKLSTYELEYLSFLEDKEIIIKVSDKFINSFPPVSSKYDSPFLIHSFNLNYQQISSRLNIISNEIFIPFIYLNCKDEENYDLFKRVQENSKLELFLNAKLIYIPKNQKKYYKQYLKIFNDKVVIIEKLFPNKLSKMNINLMFFNEALNYNVFFNSYLNLNEEGYISYGGKIIGNIDNIKDEFEKLIKVELLNSNTLISVTKDKIDICNDCEHKYMCFDSRIPLSKINNSKYYFKTECNYNPYIAKWKGEEGYKYLSECGVISSEKEFTIDHEKIAKINEELWGEEE